jgi:16S rRNA (guanine527-N7)-methyltransferase
MRGSSPRMTGLVLCEITVARSDFGVPDLTADRARALALTPVSRETTQRLDQLVELLLARQRITNLISSSTIPQLWTRHIADSLQLIELAPQARLWIDVGTGGGFPGLVVACVLADQPGAAVHLIESTMKKAAFLRDAVEAIGVPAMVHCTRAEDFAKSFEGRADVVSARAIAPLKSLLALCFPLLRKNGVTGLFPKGQNAELELGEAANSWKMKVELVPSRTDPAGRIVIIRDLERGKVTP